MKKLLIICGPTATGKTSLAVKLAKRFNGELISADSRQVYRGMDIGTGKDHPKDAIVYLVDVADPDEKFNAAKYYGLAWKVICEIWKKKKLPIIVGGTGFYIKAILDGIESLGIRPDWELRKILRYHDTKILGKMLQRVDPKRWERMNESDRKNPRRLIRAIEIARYTSTSEVSPRRRRGPSTSEVKLKEILFIGLTAPYKELYQRIDQRVEERVKQGVEKEIRRLLDQGYTWEKSVLGETIGYKEWQSFFENKSTKEEVIQRWKFNEHAYARRQITWFKKDKRINWFDISQKEWQDKVETFVKKWYSKINAQKD